MTSHFLDLKTEEEKEQWKRYYIDERPQRDARYREERKVRLKSFFRTLSECGEAGDTKLHELATYLGVTSAAIDILKSVSSILDPCNKDKQQEEDTQITENRSSAVSPDPCKETPQDRVDISSLLSVESIRQLTSNLQELKHEKLERLFLILEKHRQGAGDFDPLMHIVSPSSESLEYQDFLRTFLEEYQ
jgi:hypothetical protein